MPTCPIRIEIQVSFTYKGLHQEKNITGGHATSLRVQVSKGKIWIGKKPTTGTVMFSAVESDHPLLLNGRSYRGVLYVKSRGKSGLDVIEQLPLEEYLYGVLPREVGASWPAESLKAQAVVSRTYVIANMGKFADQGYDVSSDVFTQVYGGLQDESPETNAAVDATRGEILTD